MDCKLMRIAIDTGGTFTDCVWAQDGELKVLKVSSTAGDPGEAVLQAVSKVTGKGEQEVRHGTTVGTNALLERKGARVAFVTTAGFEDTIAIGRQARPTLYDWFFTKEPPLAPEELRFGVGERIASDGSILEAATAAELARLKEAVRFAEPEAIAISLLFGFANPTNERAVAEALRELGVPVSVSHEILPEFREYERGTTVLINAYLAPKMQRYLERLDSELKARDSRLHVMQSSGGIVPAAVAAREPVRTILSGPAGGVVGALAVAREAGFTKLLTFDMGGTSTDVSLIDSETGLRTTKESQIMGLPVAVPTLDIHTVGAGGGSLASFDRGGVLRVGPHSAGATPGPICYGRGGARPTVTDANLLLGRIDANWFLGGGMQLNTAVARARFAEAKESLAGVEQFAEGIIRIADSHMEKALRRVSIEQGYDTREFVLVSFGGAGPLHACALARSLSIPFVLVPNFPGALSACGILVSDFVRDYSRTVMLHAGDEALGRHFRDLEELGEREMKAEGLQGASTRSLDVRYAGQGFELAVPWSDSFRQDFHALHEQRYGHSDSARLIQIVNARVRMIARTGEAIVTTKSADRSSSNDAVLERRPIYCEGRWQDGIVYDRSCLATGAKIGGPAVIVEYSATTFLPPYVSASVDPQRNLLIEVQA